MSNWNNICIYLKTVFVVSMNILAWNQYNNEKWPKTPPVHVALVCRKQLTRATPQAHTGVVNADTANISTEQQLKPYFTFYFCML